MSSSLSQITLLQGYYKFLSLAMFLDHRIKTDKMMLVEESIRISTGETTGMMLNTMMLKKILEDIHKHPDKKNIFGYLSTISGLRWVFSSMKDLMQQDAHFERFLKELLGLEFPVFQKIIFFCRNVLSHHIKADIILTREDYEKQMLMLHHTKKMTFNFNYKEVFGAVRKGKETYGFSINIDTSTIREGQKYADIIPRHEQRMLAELCYNLSEYYKAKKLSKAAAKPEKPAPKKSHSTRRKPSRTKHTSGARNKSF